MQLSWFYLSLIAFLGFGLQAFCYKEAARQLLRSRTIIIWFSLLTCIGYWSYILLLGVSFSLNGYVVMLGLLDAIAYYSSALARLEALKFIPGHLVFLMLRANIIIVYIYAATFLGEKVTNVHIFAFIMLVATAWLIRSDNKKDKLLSSNYRLGVLLTILAVFGSAGAHIITKYAGMENRFIEYMTIVCSSMFIFAMFDDIIRGKESLHLPTKNEFLLASAVSVFNSIAWISVLYAMQKGPLSTVSFIIGMSFTIPIILSSVLHNELPSLRRVCAILLAALTLSLFKLA